MPENPLLPNAELTALLALTKRCITLEKVSAPKLNAGRSRKTAVHHAGREAVLAAAALQLGPGDLLIAEPWDLTPAELIPKTPGKTISQPSLLPSGQTKGASRLLLAAAMASALRGAGTDRIALVLLQAGSSDSAWQAALIWAQESLLPLLIVCTDADGSNILRGNGKAFPGHFDWSNVSKLAIKQKLPVLTVDGEDAVAMYRTAQEAILRARTGGGPAVLWAALPTAAELAGRSPQLRPITRLAQYLRKRGIPVT